MKLNNKGKYFDLFIYDTYHHEYSSYEGDINIPRVIVSEKPEVKVQNFGDHVNLIPFKFDSEEQFNNLAFQALMKASEVNGKVFDNFKDAAQYFTDKDIPTYKAIINSKSKTDINKGLFYDIFHEYDKYWLKLIIDDRVADDEAYIVAWQEYFGVVAARPMEDDEWYSIGVINTEGIVKVKLKE